MINVVEWLLNVEDAAFRLHLVLQLHKASLLTSIEQSRQQTCKP